MDFFTVPRAKFRVLFGFIVISHLRRRIIHFNVTEHPTAQWAAQQIVEAFLAQHPEYKLLDAGEILAAHNIPLDTGKYLQLLPHINATDGFFAAVMEKS